MNRSKELINQIYITNLPVSAEAGELRDLFSVYGEVISIRVSTESEKSEGRSYGFVRMKHNDARAAIQALNGAEYGGQTLKLM